MVKIFDASSGLILHILDSLKARSVSTDPQDWHKLTFELKRLLPDVFKYFIFDTRHPDHVHSDNTHQMFYSLFGSGKIKSLNRGEYRQANLVQNELILAELKECIPQFDLIIRHATQLVKAHLKPGADNPNPTISLDFPFIQLTGDAKKDELLMRLATQYKDHCKQCGAFRYNVEWRNAPHVNRPYLTCYKCGYGIYPATSPYIKGGTDNHDASH